MASYFRFSPCFRTLFILILKGKTRSWRNSAAQVASAEGYGKTTFWVGFHIVHFDPPDAASPAVCSSSACFFFYSAVSWVSISPFNFCFTGGWALNMKELKLLQTIGKGEFGGKYQPLIIDHVVQHYPVIYFTWYYSTLKICIVLVTYFNHHRLFRWCLCTRLAN